MRIIRHCPDKIAEIPSTLLIPGINYGFFSSRKKQLTTRGYLRFLMSRFGNKVNLRALSFKTEYQEKGQNLVKVKFRPWDEDWLRMKMIAASKGISMTLMFVIMMIWDEMGEQGDEQNRGVPTGYIKTTFTYNPEYYYYIREIAFET